MTTLRILLPKGRALIALDVALAIWVGGWLWLGIAIGHEVEGLRQLSGTVTKVGQAVKQTGDTLSTLSSVPLVGGQIGDTAHQIQDAGVSTVHSGRASRSSVRNLSWMLALAIAVIPSVPVIGFYLPLRLLDVRERRRLRRLASTRWGDPEFRRYLAHRALFTMPYHRLPSAAGDPWMDYANGRFDALADAELRRLGVDSRSRAGTPR